MEYSKNEVMQYVTEEDVKFIRMAFCDVYGNQKNICRRSLTVRLNTVLPSMPLLSRGSAAKYAPIFCFTLIRQRCLCCRGVLTTAESCVCSAILPIRTVRRLKPIAV